MFSFLATVVIIWTIGLLFYIRLRLLERALARMTARPLQQPDTEAGAGQQQQQPSVREARLRVGNDEVQAKT
ncbi:hypothetical protein KEM52_003720, partial [Ascosphaera acerosa]